MFMLMTSGLINGNKQEEQYEKGIYKTYFYKAAAGGDNYVCNYMRILYKYAP